MRGEGLLTGQLWNEEELEEMVTGKNLPPNASSLSRRFGRTSCHSSKGKTKAKGHSKKFVHESMDDIDDWAFATSSRPRDVYSAKVKVSSPDYDLNDAFDIYAACRAIDAACGAAEGDNLALDIDATCHAIDVACACASEIDAACHAIDVACALKMNDANGNSECCSDGKTGLVPADMKLACHVDDAVMNNTCGGECASSYDDDDDDVAIDICDNTNLFKAFDDGAMDDGHFHIVNHDDVIDESQIRFAKHDQACTNMVSSEGPSRPSVNEKSNFNYDKISDITSIDNDNKPEIALSESDGNDWYHVATVDADDWYLC